MLQRSLCRQWNNLHSMQTRKLLQVPVRSGGISTSSRLNLMHL